MNEPSQVKFSLNITIRKIHTALSLVVLLNILMLVGTWLYNSGLIITRITTIRLLLVQFNLATENVAAAWYSSMLLFLAGVAAFVCFLVDMEKRYTGIRDRVLNIGWLGITAIFILLSFDEMGSFHEMIGETALFKKMGHGTGAGWVAFYALIGITGLFMISFFILKFKTNKLALLLTVLAVLLFLSNPFQEKYEINAYRNAANPATWKRPMFFLLLEEGSEIFASFFFLYSFVIYSIAGAGSGIDNLSQKCLKLNLYLKKRFVYYLSSFVLLLGFIMLMVRFNAWHIPGDDNGIPQNWFPSVMFFVTFLISTYLYFVYRNDNGPNTSLFLSLASVSVITSVFFGSDIYDYREGPFSKISYLLLALTVLTSGMAILKMNSVSAKVVLLFWILFITCSVYSKVFGRFYPAAFGYLAASSLLFGLYFHYRFAGVSGDKI